MSNANPESRENETAVMPGQVHLANGTLDLLVDTSKGLNPCGLADKQGQSYANADYIWPEGKSPKLKSEPVWINGPNGDRAVTFTATLGDLLIEQMFTAPAHETNTLTETIRLRNTGDEPLDLPDFACGFAKRFASHEGKPADTPDMFRAIPYLVHTETGERCEYSISDLALKKNWFSIDYTAAKHEQTPLWGSEAWAWSNGKSMLLITKYNPDAMEWSLLDPMRHGDDLLLRFGGAGHWKYGHPERASRLEPGAAFTFGTTRYKLIDGGIQECFYDFRRFMDSKGHVAPPNYNPPVHWNELYDNPFWWAGDTAQHRDKLYRRADMEAEAAKAKELGCEALYLDPGWDTSMASCIWAADRLGDQAEFVQCLKEKYGLKLALHTPLAAWSDVRAYPEAARVKDKEGITRVALCSANAAYLDTKADRLLELCKKGACFLMFDGSWFTGECYDPAHGHSIPLTRQEQLEAYLKLNQRVHAQFPNVLIEQHDPCVGGTTVRYAPTYILHGKPGSFDELWGYEYMWDPMADLLSGKALSLYYANLAYSIPIYLHIDLRKDNANALEFWWYASTCRHLGVGGKHPDPKVWDAHKEAMKSYMNLKRFYTQGIFYGLDETVHAHTLPNEGKCVINVFNLSDTEIERELRFKPAEVGLRTQNFQVDIPSMTKEGDLIILRVPVPPKSHRLISLSAS
jgi:hypothetical protein